MYTTNLPDGVLIPDLLVDHIEDGLLTVEAQGDTLTWAKSYQDANEDFKVFWLRQIRSNVELCQRYGLPECAKFFDYVSGVIEKVW